jgi:hypothetical protein
MDLKGNILVRVTLVGLIILCFAVALASDNVHRCAGAGFWFPADKKELADTVDGYLKGATKKDIPGNLIALISPHAGYTYSGPIMGAAYRQLEGRKYKRVIILALSHSYGGFGKISVLPVDIYQTPLGDVPVDKKVVEELLGHNDIFVSIPVVHAQEHSDENQIPFLQRTLKDFKMVSLIVDQLNPDEMKKAADILVTYLDTDTLFIASTDLNHYGSLYHYEPFANLKGTALADKIHQHDREALKYMTNIDPEGFLNYIRQTGSTVCGRNPVELLLSVLKKKGDVQGHLLDYYTSADKDGMYALRTCGYGAVAFSEIRRSSNVGGTASSMKTSPVSPKGEVKKMDKETTPTEVSEGEPDPPILNEAEQKTLLRLARDVLQGITKDRSYQPDYSKYDLTPHLKEKSRLFVTLTKGGDLRGCIGHVQAIVPIYEGVVENTFSAAFRDPRFPPVRADEVPDIRIEISINTPQRLLKDVNKIVIGKHGLVIEKGWNRGILLPQVPVEWKWNRDEFLKHICLKAGLPTDAWKDKDTKLYSFSSQVFHEKE